MVRKRSPASRDAQPPKIDDLKLINGIGPGVEKRLNGVGICTFAQLAALSPADVAAAVADLTGLSTERIIKQDWIGQARKLAVESVESEAQKDIEAPVEPPTSTEERAPAAPHPVEPQLRKPTSESLSNEAPKDIEPPAVTEQFVAPTAAVEPPAPAPVEVTHAATPSLESEKDTVPSLERHHRATFTVEFLLDQHNKVEGTHVLHIQSGREDTWKGWQQTQLADFLSEMAGLNIPSDEPALSDSEKPEQLEEPDHAPAVVAESKFLAPPEAEHRLIGKLHVREMEIIGVASSSPRKTLTRDTPFDVRLTLDLSELQVPGHTPLNYKASVYSKGQGSPGLILGEAQGTIIPADSVTIKVERNTLLEVGLYQLVAQVIVGLPTMQLRVRPGTTAVIDGGQVQVF